MSDAKEKFRAFRFAGIIAFVCCLLITGASTGLKKFQLENKELDRQKNVLSAAGAFDGKDPGSDERIRELYKQRIEKVRVNNQGRLIRKDKEQGLTLYLYTIDGKLAAYIVPIESRGLWGKINGYMAIEKDGKTVAGFSVYNHSETPGLGGEIEKEWFGKNFVGKRIVNRSGEFVSVAVAKGEAEDLPEEKRKHYVDGISGATLTGKYLSEGIKKNLKRYEPVSVQFQQQDQPVFQNGNGVNE